ncbi:MAG: serine hydrolase [Bacteroidales bacterium]|nr:serine hydrolase [Bacteroidales bacterium]
MKVLDYIRRYGWKDLPALITDYRSRKRGYKDVFVAEMNRKAASIGASSACFPDASGLKWRGSAASPRDFIQILIHALQIPQIAEKWGKDRYEISVQGQRARTVSIASTVFGAQSGISKYPILGGKTGTITAPGHVNYNLAWITSVNGVRLACVLMGGPTDESRWRDARKLVDYLDSFLQGQPVELTVETPRLAVCKLPCDSGIPELLVSKSPDETGIPASLTKLMALVTAYDYISDEDEMVRIVPSDIIGGSGDNLSAGDLVSIRDLVYDMLLPSSNEAAVALSRHIGAKILKSKKQ